MATTNIDVNKQNVVDLLKSGKDHPFVIPEYQRPYAWSDDEIITLFDDIWNFSIERTTPEGANTYFLGSIVSFENEKGEKEIIDGQQRITSLFLLLRAVYAKLEQEENKTKEVLNFISKIQPALWLENELTGEVDKTKILLRSEVATDHGNEILRKILETGVADKTAKDNYSRNFNKFLELYDEKAKNSSLQMFYFINALLNYSILLPISADSQDTALTIFSTLNNRGLPLSDADIFKSHLYKQLDAQNKKEFANKWKELEADASECGESIQSLFYYQMFHMRATDGDEKSTIPGVRKYFLDKEHKRLNLEIIDKLVESLNLWKVVNSGVVLQDEPWSQNMEILQILDCLSSYTNEFWKYPVLIFYNCYKKDPLFEKLFLKFLRKLCVMLLRRYLETPTVNAVKSDILKLNVLITKTPEPEFSAEFKTETVSDIFIAPRRNMVRMLLKILAYNSPEQKTLLPDKWEIEHIFPQKWDTSFFTLSDDEANIKLEHLGNKIPLEKPMNIRASNNYFDKKKDVYGNSNIAIAKALGKSNKASWVISDIDARDIQVNNELVSLLDQWVKDYEPKADTPSAPQPTPEQAEMIRQLKAAGLI
jgi:uncharacterized protein with ParB-like and HNH nuclease domain